MNKKIVFSIIFLLSTAPKNFYAAEKTKLELTHRRAQQEAKYLAELMLFNEECEKEKKELEALAAIQEELAEAIAEKEILKGNRTNSEQLNTTQVAALNKEIEALTQRIKTLQEDLAQSQANYEAQEAKYKRARNLQNKEIQRLRKAENTILNRIKEIQTATTTAQAAVIAAVGELNETKAARLKLKGGPSWTATFRLATDTDEPVDPTSIQKYSPRQALALPGAHASQSDS
ncbi:MAG: hypothetical protein EBU90_05230 [Proteobacteria bacterium]|nr:hypothetical protein [Pseudomonadota bacterium]